MCRKKVAITAAMTRGLLLLLTVVVLPCQAQTGQWVAVVAPDLREALKPLEQQRQSEGWAVTVLPAETDLQITRKLIADMAAKPGPLCVLLVGDFSPEAGGAGVPTGKGTQLRMAGIPSDALWNRIEGQPDRIVETGRLPARNAPEASAMVAKILAWPAQSAAAGPFPRAGLIAGHHGAPALFSGMADSLTNSLALRLVSRLPASWEMRAAVHVDGSPWQVSGEDAGKAARAMMSSPFTLLAYMGHSSPQSPVSKGQAMLGVGDWHALKGSTPRTGLFFSCGCFTTELDPKEESFGFAAMRSPGGPAAVIGSHGITYAAFGYLAMCGLVEALNADPAPSRLGELWHGTRGGLARQEISSSEFAMLDLSDGTGGRVPLAAQRLEHLESWMLLGDPAMPVLPAAPSVPLSVSGKVTPGTTITVSGILSPPVPDSFLRVSLERHPGTIRKDLPEVPDSGDSRAAVARERRELSENVVLVGTAIPVSGREFETKLPLPRDLPAGPWTLRVSPVKGTGPAGVLRIAGPEN